MQISTTLHRTHIFIRALPFILVATLFLHGCTVKQHLPPVHRKPPSRPAPQQPEPQLPVPQEPAPQEPTGVYTPKTGPAAALYHTAKSSLDRGDLQQAEMTLERALRIEPRNAHYWHTLAQVKYQQKQYSQAIHLCLKSKSLAGKDQHIIQLNEQLIARARAQNPQ
jgi:predicted Zn-dependent protease